MFYTYILAYPDGAVFYVGKGQGNRIDDHEKEAAKGIVSPKCEVVRKIWAGGGRVIKYRVFETPIEEDALLYEWILINLVYGVDNLTNTSDGGGRLLLGTKNTSTKSRYIGRQKAKEDVKDIFHYCFKEMGIMKTSIKVPSSITKWPPDLSQGMKWYYTKHYVRREGKAHKDYVGYFHSYRGEEKM